MDGVGVFEMRLSSRGSVTLILSIVDDYGHV